MKQLHIVIPVLFFLSYLALGLSIYNDYGISWDEELQRQHGLVSAQFVKEKLNLPGEDITWRKLRGYEYPYHGVLFTLPAYGLERWLGLESFREQYLLRHLMVFLLFWSSTVVFFFIARRRLGDWRWALLATTFLIISPRIFAHSFFNVKDLVLLPLFIFATGSLLLFLEKRSLWYAALHALTCAMAISMRVAAVILPALTLGYIFLELLNNRFEKKLLGRFGRKLLVYLPLTVGLTIGLWPYLWDQPFIRFPEAFDIMSQYTWGGKVMLRGKLLFGTEIPWWYAPYWIFITTPLLYTFLFFTGIVFIVKNVIASLAEKGRLFTSATQRADLVFLGLSLGPLVAVISRDPVLYDGWRHLYFIYPAFLLVGVGGLQNWLLRLRENKDGRVYRCARRAFAGVIGLTLAYNVHFMITNHPHQQVYFNALTLGDKLTRLDLDYWGLTYYQGLQYIARQHPNDTVSVAYQSYPAELNWKFLPDSLQQRIQLVEKPDSAQYYISNYRHWEPGIEAYLNRAFPYNGEEVYTVQVEESKVLGVYRMGKQD